jgi:hypothetical protein
LALAIITIFTGDMVRARSACLGAELISNLRESYRATLLEVGGTRRQAAIALLAMLGGQNAMALAERVDTGETAFDIRHLAEVLHDAEALARDTLSNSRNRDPGFQHVENIVWLSQRITATGCR